MLVSGWLTIVDFESLKSQLKDDAERQRLADAAFVAGQRLKASLSPQIWRSLCVCIQERVDVLAQDVGRRVVIEGFGSNKVKLTDAVTGNGVSLEFSEDVPCVWYNTRSMKDYYAFRPDRDGVRVKLLDHRKDVPLEADQAADEIMTLLLAR